MASALDQPADARADIGTKRSGRLRFLQSPIVSLLRETVNEWSKDKASRLAAALAYYTMFSFAPLLIVVIATVGLVFGRDAAQGHIMAQLGDLLGQQGLDVVQEMIRKASQPRTGITATIIGIVTLVFGASGVFGQLQDGLNTVWEVQPKPGRSWRDVVRQRFASFTMVIGIGFLLLVSLVVNAAVAAVTGLVAPSIPGGELIVELLTLIVSFAVVTVLFAMMFKTLPDVEIQWRDVWVGAAATAFLFTLGKFAIGLYLGHSDVASSFGAAGSLVLLLVWVYYSAQILFLGAEFTQVYANRFGSGFRTDSEARPVTANARAEQGLKGPPSRTSESPAPDRG